MKLYRYFRHKKYGEPLPVEETIPKPDLKPSASDLIPPAETHSDFDILTEEELDILRQAKITITRKLRGASTRLHIKRRGSQLNQDLGTVIEEESMADSDILQRSQMKPKPEVFSHQEQIEAMIEGELYLEVYMMAEKVMKVKAFLQMIIARRRYLRVKSAALKIKSAMMKYLRVKKAKEEAKKQKDEKNIA